MAAALDTFAAEPCAGRRVAVLGDMFELGAESAALHEEVRRKALGLGLDKVFFVGRNFGGVPFGEAKAALFAYVKPGDSVLLKASHSMALGRMLEP
jgi:UDP-N-acetylmuramoyl-tripeptide--D-alanyl-D-alanine ligase